VESGGPRGRLTAGREILLDLPVYFNNHHEVQIGVVMEKQQELIEKFMSLPPDQRVLFEHLLEDCIAGQVRLMDEMERDEMKKDFDDDVSW